MKRILATILLLAAAAVHAQTMVAKSIVFEGTPQFPSSELLGLTGLTPGRTLSKDDIETAMHKLDDSGLFSSIQYTTANGTLTFVLEPSGRAALQRVSYVNFPWYTQEQLNAKVHEKLPLFTGSVPAQGDLPAKVERTLEAILKERGIAATVTSQGASGGKLEYSIASPKVIVGELHIANVHFDSDPVLTAVHEGLVGAEYLEGITQKAIQGNLGYALKELGYLDSTVGAIGHAEPVATPDRIVVDMTGTAQPGALYHVAAVNLPALAGSVTTKDLAGDQANQVQVGGIPSPSLAQNGLARMIHVYQDHGFLDAHVTVEVKKDSAAHTMSYTYTGTPGEVYRMRSLVFDAGMSSAQQSQLTQAWKLPKGDIYSGQLVGLSRMAPTVNKICNGKPAYAQPVPDKATHQVDVNLSCTRPGRLVD